MSLFHKIKTTTTRIHFLLLAGLVLLSIIVYVHYDDTNNNLANDTRLAICTALAFFLGIGLTWLFLKKPNSLTQSNANLQPHLPSENSGHQVITKEVSVDVSEIVELISKARDLLKDIVLAYGRQADEMTQLKKVVTQMDSVVEGSVARAPIPQQKPSAPQQAARIPSPPSNQYATMPIFLPHAKLARLLEESRIQSEVTSGSASVACLPASSSIFIYRPSGEFLHSVFPQP